MLGAATAAATQDLMTVVADWEERLDARIGVELRDTSSNWTMTHRADERFPMSSTFKPLLCGMVLARAEAGEEDLNRRIRFTRDDLVPHSPVTARHLTSGMTVRELCDATITVSDNTAGNLLLDTIGGPEGLTHALCGMGDPLTRLDRWETALNQARPGDPRDTTTPTAILETLENFLFGDVLKPAAAAQLREWLIDDQLADGLLRMHLPKGWVIGDKTGAGGYGSRAIIAFLHDTSGTTYLAAIYLTESDADFPLRNRVIADIGKAMIDEIEAR